MPLMILPNIFVGVHAPKQLLVTFWLLNSTFNQRDDEEMEWHFL